MQKKLNLQIVFLILLFILQFVLVQIAKSSQSFLQFYAQYLYPLYNQKLLNFSSKFSFPIGEWFYAIIGFSLLYVLIRGAWHWFFNSKILYKEATIALLLMLNLFYLLFNCSWGLNYAKKSFSSEFYIEQVSATELKAIAENELMMAKHYRGLVKENQQGVFRLSSTDEDLKHAIVQHQLSLYNLAFLNSQYFVEKPNIKASYFSELSNYLGILGYYNPFTAEANYNARATDLNRPFTMAHELAHQIGYAPENEANFMAYIMADLSNDADFKYSAHHKTLMAVLRQLVPLDPEFVQEIMGNLSDGMQRDREHELAHHAQYSGVANDVFANLNDAYLKANQQDGIVTYSRYVLLVSAYYRWKNAN
ncbi:DUF3810 domain-containing protein [Vaginella massiliensis]|uniref:DUF3810 domain-containing protein n=1 Tax=Vaginella massiliensis TaxID=1816680 RepID=UPI00083852A5|nr:DUF3810 domain-containing protein [Vaginella massiliensis]